MQYYYWKSSYSVCGRIYEHVLEKADADSLKSNKGSYKTKADDSVG